MAMTESFDDFFDVTDFAIDFVYSGLTLKGILDEEYIEIHGVDSYQPVLLTESSHGITQGESLTVGTDNYAVRSAQPDGTGLTQFILERMP